MSWDKVGGWIKDNAGTGASLIGSLLTGNIAGAVSAGVSLVSGATGTDNPELALQELTNNPDAMVKLKEIYYKNEDSVRRHIETIHLADLEDKQKEHETTARVIVEGQKAATGWFEKNSRPMMAWGSLLFTFWYLGYALIKGVTVSDIGLVVASGGYFAWMGLRSLDKKTAAKINKDMKK